MKPWIPGAGAVACGFLVTAVASTAADAIMHAAGVFPRSPQNMSAPDDYTSEGAPTIPLNRKGVDS